MPAPAWWLRRTDGFHKQNLFKTAYTAQFDCTGDITVFGVKGSQVLIQGRRVNLAMVERHLMKSHEAIQRASVRKVVFKGQQTLASILEFQRESTINNTLDSTNGVLALTPEIATALKKIQKSISETIESHAVPSLYIPVEEIPLEESKGWLRNILSSLSREDLYLYTLNSADEYGLS
jgi:acyl-coenzyme A synthetase/AMP-(fatty) acid ligase